MLEHNYYAVIQYVQYRLLLFHITPMINNNEVLQRKERRRNAKVAQNKYCLVVSYNIVPSLLISGLAIIPVAG